MRQHWLWVAHEDSWTVPGGSERNLGPPAKSTKDIGWTCDPSAKPGDLVLSYRTSPRKDIKYLFEVMSKPRRRPARSDRDMPGSERLPGAAECSWRSVFAFHTPLVIAEMRADRVLKDWGALRFNFQNRSFFVEPDIWKRLTVMLTSRNPGVGDALRALRHSLTPRRLIASESCWWATRSGDLIGG